MPASSEAFHRAPHASEDLTRISLDVMLRLCQALKWQQDCLVMRCPGCDGDIDIGKVSD